MAAAVVATSNLVEVIMDVAIDDDDGILFAMAVVVADMVAGIAVAKLDALFVWYKSVLGICFGCTGD